MKISGFLVGRQKLVLMKGGGGIFAEYFGGDFSDVIVGGMNLGMEVTVKKVHFFCQSRI